MVNENIAASPGLKNKAKEFFASSNSAQQQYNLVQNGKHAEEISTNLAPTFEYYGQYIAKFNPLLLQYMEDADKHTTKETIEIALYHLYCRFELNNAASNNSLLKDDVDAIKKCVALLDKIDKRKKSEPSPYKNLETFVDEQYKKAGIPTLIYVNDGITKVNDWRLYFVWVTCILDSIIIISREIADRYGCDESRLSDAVKLSNFHFLRWLSVLLYPIRFLYHLSMILKHVLLPSAAEKEKLTWSERFNAEWQKRKFVMFNDLIWGIVNSLCALWLHPMNGELLAYYGNVITVILLFLDLSLTIWSQYEKRAQHNKHLDKIEEKIKGVNSELVSLRQNRKTAETDKEIEILEKHLKSVENEKAHYELNWKYTDKHLKYSIVYSIVLLAAFIVMVGGLLSLTPPAYLYFAGAAGLFVPSVIYAGASSHLEVDKSREITLSRINELNDMLEHLKDSGVKDKSLLELQCFELQQEIKHQQELTAYHSRHFYRTLALNALTPFFIFAAFVSLPVNLAVIALAAIFMIAVSSHLVLESTKPQREVKENKIPKFDAEEVIKWVGQEEAAVKSDATFERAKNWCAGLFGIKATEKQNALKLHPSSPVHTKKLAPASF